MNIFFTQSFLEFFGTAFFGFLIFTSLIFVKQRWANTMAYFITFILLPPTTYVITKVISNNLALSLGMIGALSIVRFRNPVKSPLELVIYFSLITIGISMGVDYFWSIVLEAAIILILLSTYFFEKLLKSMNFKTFEYSFNSNDGLKVNFLEIETDKPMIDLEKNQNLTYFSKSGEKNYYKLAIYDKEELRKIVDQIKDNKTVKNIEIQYSN